MRRADTRALLAAASDGDADAWSLLVDQFAPLVWSVARGYRLGAPSTDDLVQTVWLRLAEHSHRIREPEKLAGWLATTTRNQALDMIRRRDRQIPTGELPRPVVVDDRGVDEALLASEELAEVLDAFGQLDNETKLYLRLFCADPPLDYQSISEVTGRPVGSLGPTRIRCLKKLREAMATQQAAGDKGGRDHG